MRRGALLDTNRSASVAAQAPEVDELGNHEEMAHIETIMREGTGADRQLAVWERTQDIRAVVDHIIAETYEDLPVHENAAQARAQPYE